MPKSFLAEGAPIEKINNCLPAMHYSFPKRLRFLTIDTSVAD